MDDHKHIRDTLLTRKQALGERISSVKADLAQQRPADFSEQVTERENEDVLKAIQQESEKELASINRALVKIDDGEYGICDRCGRQIAAARLKALPYTTLCVECADQ